MSDNKILLFLIENDSLFSKSLEMKFEEAAETIVNVFTSGELCIENLSHKPDIIVLDYHLNSVDKNAINGLETLDRIKTINPQLPVIMLSSHDQIEVAANCMKHQAYDYVVKSETAFIRIQKAISRIIHHQKMEKALSWYMEKM